MSRLNISRLQKVDNTKRKKTRRGNKKKKQQRSTERIVNEVIRQAGSLKLFHTADGQKLQTKSSKAAAKVLVGKLSKNEQKDYAKNRKSVVVTNDAGSCVAYTPYDVTDKGFKLLRTKLIKKRRRGRG